MQNKIEDLIQLLYPNYFLKKDINKLKAIYTAGHIGGLLTAQKIVSEHFDKDDALTELGKVISKYNAEHPKNFQKN